jgi:transposase-like protein
MHRKFDDSFKIMAVELSIGKGSVSEVAKGLYIDPVCSVDFAGTHVSMATKFFRTTLR